MIPLGTVLTITPSVGPSLISLYNLYPSASIVGVQASGFSSGDAIKLMEAVAADTLPPGTGAEWTALSFQEKLVGNQMYLVFALALLLVYLVLAGQYESWFAPVAVLLAAPLSLIGPVSVLLGLNIDNNLYVADRADPADRAVGQERDPDRRGGARAACRGQADRRGGDRGGARALPPDPDDVVRLHPRRRCRWCWRQAPGPARASRSASPSSAA